METRGCVCVCGQRGAGGPAPCWPGCPYVYGGEEPRAQSDNIFKNIIVHQTSLKPEFGPGEKIQDVPVGLCSRTLLCLSPAVRRNLVVALEVVEEVAVEDTLEVM